MRKFKLLRLEAIIGLVAVLGVIYHLVSVVYLLQPFGGHMATHLAFGLVLSLLVLMRNRQRKWPLFLLLAVSVATIGYLRANYDDIMMIGWFPDTIDVIVAVLLVAAVLETTRRVFGIALPILVIVFGVYVYFGNAVPGAFHLAPYTVTEIIHKTFMEFSAGLFAVPLMVSVNYIFLFIVFAAVIMTTGAIKPLINAGNLIGRRFRSGPAMTAVVASSLMGTISGSASANIAITGSFTIPYMKRVGYRPEQAAAIEAAASNGGQIMPPVMGAAAFLMAAFTGVRYLTIVQLAVLPAVLYYLSVAIYVQFQSMKLGITIDPRELKVDYREMLVFAPALIVPVSILVALLVIGYTPQYSVSLSILAAVVVSLVRKETRRSFREWVQGLTTGAIGGAQIALMCATIGLIVQFAWMTGLGHILASQVVAVGSANLLLALVLTMVASLLLGTGVPTSAAYLIVAFFVAPALVDLGIELMAAHFFVFYFAVFSLVTPPVAPAALTASVLAGANFWKTGVEAFKVSAAGFLIPYLMIWSPLVTMKVPDPLSVVLALVSFPIMILCLQVALTGYYIKACTKTHRILAGATLGILTIFWATQNHWLLFAGLAVFAIVTYLQVRQKRSSN